MLLPNADRAEIDAAKLADYLLNPAHPDNGGKAAFFLKWGFPRTSSVVLEQAIRRMILHTPVKRQVKSAFGEKHIVEGTLDSPAGTTPVVRTIWIVDSAHAAPRLVTAYPCRGDSHD